MNTNTATRFVNKSILYLKKYSPQILTGIGVGGFAATVVLAAKETLEVQPILDDHKVFIEHHEEMYEKGEIDKKEFGKNNLSVWFDTSKKIARLYAPAVGTGVLTLTCFLGSHKIMSQRNVALVAAYNALDGVYSRYREEVRMSIGEEEDRELFQRAVANPEVTPRDERSQYDEENENYLPKISQYAKYFDWNSSLYDDDADTNKTLLMYKERYLNDLLASRGHVFLNDVYDELDIPRTKAGAVVGWLYDYKEEGDGYIDLGIFQEVNAEAINGVTRSRWLLDPNVEGVVYDLLPN